MSQIYPTHHENPLLYAGFWKRFVAYMVDSIIRVILTWIIIFGAAYMDDPSQFLDSSGDTELGPAGTVGALIVLLMYLFYHPLFEVSRHQATPGKMLMGIIVVDTAGQRLSLGRAFGRHLAGFITWMTSFLVYFGYWMAGITARKQALHDLIANCLVINRNARVEPDETMRQVSAGFPVWAAILVGLAFMVPVAGILAAIAIPAYVTYSDRATVMATINETRSLRQMIAERTASQGLVPPASHHDFERNWPQSLNEGKALAKVVDGTLWIHFTQRASSRLQGQTIGLAMHAGPQGQIEWQCGFSPERGRRLSGPSGAELTTVEDQLLPTECRATKAFAEVHSE